MKIEKYYKASTLDEAYEVLLESKNNLIIGGGAWLRLTNKNLETVVDVSKIGLEGIVKKGNRIEIGAMTTLKDMEDNMDIQNLYDGMLSNALSHIMGVSIRNIATIGGSIIGKYSFSDILTPLLVMNTSLVFHKQGEMKLGDFLNTKKLPKDILTKIIVEVVEGNGYFYKMQKTHLDFAVVNVAITKDEDIQIAVGARPSLCTVPFEAVTFINSQKEISEEVINKTASIAANELKFGTNSKASKEYRKQIVEVYIKRGLREVMSNEN